MNASAKLLEPSIELPEFPADRLEGVSTQDNPRSTTGIISDRQDPSGPRLFFKQFREREILLREAVALEHARAAAEGIDGMRPLVVRGICSERKWLITEYVENSQSLYNYVWNGTSWAFWKRVSPLALTEIGSRVAEWMSAFHARTRASGDSPLTNVERLIEDTASKLDALRTRFPAQLATPTLDRVGRYLADAECHASEWNLGESCMVHGDFALPNLRIDSRGNVVVVDFADARPGVPHEDLTRLWHDLWAISETTSHRRRALSGCLEALMVSFGGRTAMEKSPLLRVCRTFNAVCYLLTYCMCRQYFGFTGRLAAQKQLRVNLRWLETLSPEQE